MGVSRAHGPGSQQYPQGEQPQPGSCSASARAATPAAHPRTTCAAACCCARARSALQCLLRLLTCLMEAEAAYSSAMSAAAKAASAGPLAAPTDSTALASAVDGLVQLPAAAAAGHRQLYLELQVSVLAAWVVVWYGVLHACVARCQALPVTCVESLSCCCRRRRRTPTRWPLHALRSCWWMACEGSGPSTITLPRSSRRQFIQ